MKILLSGPQPSTLKYVQVDIMLEVVFADEAVIVADGVVVDAMLPMK